MTEKEHARKQVQMHNLAKSIAEQMARKLGKTCGEIFSYNSAFLGKMLNDTDGSSEIVTIEKFIEGSPFVEILILNFPQLLWRKLKLWPISLTMLANKNFCQLIYKELATDYVTPKQLALT